jgi:CheY-like chemotaxis protein
LAVKDGEEALELLYQDSISGQHGISLIVLDLTLPRVDGREVLKRIWNDKRLRHIPVIVLSSSKSDDDLIRSYKTGAVAFLRKPIKVLDFLQAILDLNSYTIMVVKGDMSER